MYARFLAIKAEKAKTKKISLNRSELENFLKQPENKGYVISKEKKKYVVLMKPTQYTLLILTSQGGKEVNAEKSILNFYQKRKLTSTLFDKFRSDLANGKIFLEYKEGNVNIKRRT